MRNAPRDTLPDYVLAIAIGVWLAASMVIWWSAS